MASDLDPNSDRLASVGQNNSRTSRAEPGPHRITNTFGVSALLGLITNDSANLDEATIAAYVAQQRVVVKDVHQAQGNNLEGELAAKTEETQELEEEIAIFEND